MQGQNSAQLPEGVINFTLGSDPGTGWGGGGYKRNKRNKRNKSKRLNSKRLKSKRTKSKINKNKKTRKVIKNIIKKINNNTKLIK